MCTSLSYRDVAGKVYFGRTLELTVDLPYQIAWLPSGLAIHSEIEGHPPVEFNARNGMLTVTMPCRRPSADAPLGVNDFKVLEGLNDKGLTFSLLSYPAAAGTHRALPATQAVLSASDLGSWILGQFATVVEVRAALAAQPILLEPLAILGGVESPFHYVVHDASGAAVVIEFSGGKMSLYDNPVGVMTNGPEFPWHLTNLNNYTHLTNVDVPAASFGAYRAVQPDSGIATAALPASNTSVGRFVRAAFFAHFSEKATTPDLAVRTLAHVMNNFDRPRGASIDYPQAGGGSHMEVAGLEPEKTETYATEFTSWTSMSDLDRKLFFIRDYQSLNFTSFDVRALASLTVPKLLPLKALNGGATDATDILKAA